MMPQPPAEKSSSVDRLYEQLRLMAADFKFKPEERINESALALQLGASRTPVREALNRLVAEGYITFQTGRGFFCRPLNPKRILDLYEARIAIECAALRLTVQRAGDSDIKRLSRKVAANTKIYQTTSDVLLLLQMDEEFHMDLTALSGNDEFYRILKNLNGRIRYVRLINLTMLQKKWAADPSRTLSFHQRIMSRLATRNEDEAVETLKSHIARRRQEAIEDVRSAYSQLYVPDEEEY